VIAEQIKMRLSTADLIEERVAALAYGEGGKALDLELRITRAEFEALIRPIVARAIDCTRRVLADAGVTPEAVDEILLAGGATRVPLVQQMVTELFRRQPKSDINPMEVVAVGAALHAHNLYVPDAGQGGLLMDVTSHGLGIATAGGYAEQLIAKNTAIPTESTRVFTTARDNQTVVRIRVCQGEHPRFADNVEVGELHLHNLRAATRGQVEIEVTFLIDANGICSVAARDLETQQTAQATLSLLGLSQPIPIGG
jgi:molecular chaperone DnaK